MDAIKDGGTRSASTDKRLVYTNPQFDLALKNTLAGYSLIYFLFVGLKLDRLKGLNHMIAQVDFLHKPVIESNSSQWRMEAIKFIQYRKQEREAVIHRIYNCPIVCYTIVTLFIIETNGESSSSPQILFFSIFPHWFEFNDSSSRSYQDWIIIKNWFRNSVVK